MRIAVIGSGISGNGAAWALKQGASGERREVVLYEKDLRPGGHAHTVDVEVAGKRIPVDVGFIVYNDLNYPNLIELFRHLDVPTKASNMSFAVSVNRGEREWKGDDKLATGLFARRRNLVSPRFWGMLLEILRFNRVALADKAAGRLDGVSLGDWLARHRFSGRVLSDYLIPMGAAIWSMPPDEIKDFPAKSFVAFFDNHRLVQFDRPVWRTVDGGSRVYVKKIAQALGRGLRLGTAVTAVERKAGKVIVTDASGQAETFDHVVFAAHSDQTLRMLADPSEAEASILSAVRYRPNDVYLHRDPALMPKRRAAWAAWNFLNWEAGGAITDRCSVSYSMNILQGIPDETPMFVSLNPPEPPRAELTHVHFVTDHPQYDAAAIAAQARLPEIQGERNTWFCGAWTAYGFHEDGLASGLAVAEALGAEIPWRTPTVPTPYREAAE